MTRNQTKPNQTTTTKNELEKKSSGRVRCWTLVVQTGACVNVSLNEETVYRFQVGMLLTALQITNDSTLL